jgi:hypothetical protein
VEAALHHRDLGNQRVRPRADGVGASRLQHGQRAGFAAKIDGLMAHAGEDMTGKRSVAGGPRQPERLAEIATGRAVPAAVICHHPRPAGEDRGGGQQLPPDAVAVDAMNERRYLSP